MAHDGRGVIQDGTQAETGCIKKKWTGRLSVALVFPNVYQLGMSNLGFQHLYRILNSFDELVCERVFLPQQGRPVSVESQRLLTDFSLIFCSISFEADFLHLLQMLAAAGIEPLAEHRSKNDDIGPGNPLLVGGGVATFINPEPLAPFFDLLVLGEAEPVVTDLVRLFCSCFTKSPAAKKDLLYEIGSLLPGCYVPSFYTPIYDANGAFSHFDVADGLPARIQLNRLRDPEEAGSSSLLTEKTEFSNIYLTELGRGCSRGCRFCAAGYVYRPPRLWNAAAVIKAINKKPASTNRVGLLGMEMAHQDDLEAIARCLMQGNCTLSFSSLRADRITPALVAILQQSALKSAAIAPDGGSERLRRVISKNISEDDLLTAADILVRAGVKNLKLYFMIGLPTETDADLEEMAALVMKIRAQVTEIGRRRGHLCTLTLSVNSFVPKAWTPFQFVGFTPVKVLKKKIQLIRKRLGRLANVRLSFDNPDRAFFQALLARGDRRVGRALLAVARQKRNWRHVLVEEGIEVGWYALRERERTEPFPWEIIEHGIKKQYLWQEYQKALQGIPSRGCLINEPVACKKCGVCC